MRSLLIFLTILITGCAGRVDISNKELSSELNGKCYSATTNMTVYSADTIPNTTYELISPKLKELPWRTSLAPWEKAFTIKKGDELRISKVYDRANGSSGHCWEIFATTEAHPEIEFEIPACWLNHTMDNWVEPKYPHKQKQSNEKLRINTDLLIVKKCI